MNNRQYVTTAIDYPNAAPHLGHVLEKVLADVVARWFRMSGRATRFQIGVDEHGIKMQQTAEKQGMTPEALVDMNVPLFEDMYGALNVSADVFMRTSDRPTNWKNVDAYDHEKTVKALWTKLRDAGALEKRSYTGLYCSGCERFVTAKDLVDGKCPDHNIAPQEVVEENWFFKLKDKQEFLKKILTDGTYTIVPEYRAAETLELIKNGLEDVSFSRPKKSLQWSIDIPDDPEQGMYVWCDALTNYISGIDYFGFTERPFDSASQSSGSFDSTNEENGSKPKAENHERAKRVEWWNDGEVTHVIGKDIARFHALIWPAMLDYAGIRVPDRLLIHGFVTNEGQKMSKSLGNVVKPEEILARFGGYPDPIRFFLCHEIPVGRDGDFSWKRIEELYQAKLGNQLGNMLNRTLVLLGKDGGVADVPVRPGDAENSAKIWSEVSAKMDAFEIHAALQQIMEQVSCMNQGFNDAAPWKIKEDAALRITTLGTFAESLRQVALLLLPFIPDTAYRMSTQLNVPYAEDMKEKDFIVTDDLKAWGGAKGWTKVGTPEILFKPLEPKVEA